MDRGVRAVRAADLRGHEAAWHDRQSNHAGAGAASARAHEPPARIPRDARRRDNPRRNHDDQHQGRRGHRSHHRSRRRRSMDRRPARRRDADRRSARTDRRARHRRQASRAWRAAHDSQRHHRLARRSDDRLQAPKASRNLTKPDGTDLPTLVQSLGFAFATTSYRQNGLAILEGVDDMRELVSAFSVFPGVPPGFPLKTYVAGVSEGGLVATLLAERSPDLFASALATCGPVGSFQAQVDYFGDFRVLFDYFFPGVLPGSAVNVPVPLMENWYTLYAPAVAAALTATPEARARAVELLRVAKAPFDPAHPETVLQTVLGVIWYNVFATNDAIAKLGGNPYGNRFRWYFGSSNDFRLNLMVRRFSESPVAREALRKYETSGQL